MSIIAHIFVLTHISQYMLTIFTTLFFNNAKLTNFWKFQKYEKVEILPKFGFKYFLYSG